MPTMRFASASAHHEAVGLIMAGGSTSEEEISDRVLWTSYEGIYTELTNLPVKTRSGCMAFLNDSFVFVAGGESNPNVYEYSFYTSTWTSVGEMPSGERMDFGCGFAFNAFGQLELILAGGDSPDTSGLLVDIYNVEYGEWRTSGSYFIIQGSKCYYYLRQSRWSTIDNFGGHYQHFYTPLPWDLFYVPFTF